jgi:hypothetical protein
MLTSMRFIYTVKTCLAKVSEVDTALILINGDQPNAFSDSINGNRNIVGINFAMLDLVGLNMHMMAVSQTILRLDSGIC